MKKFAKEFKDFVARGNVLDLAVGVLIGGAFQSIVSSLTTNIISPIIGMFGETDFSGFYIRIHFGIINLDLGVGAFITSVINFLIMALVVFCIVKGMNKLLNKNKKEEKKEEPVAPVKSDETLLLEEIRDLLKKETKKNTKKSE